MEDTDFSAEQPVMPQEAAQESAAMPAVITDVMVEEMRQMAPWMTFLSILGFVGTGFLLIVGLVLFFMSSLLSSLHIPSFMGLIYLVMAVIIFFPYLYLYKSAESYRGFIQRGDADSVEEALSLQKKFWRYLGILAIIYFGMIILVMLMAVLVGLFA